MAPSNGLQAISELPLASFSKRGLRSILSYENEISLTCNETYFHMNGCVTSLALIAGPYYNMFVGSFQFFFLFLAGSRL